MVGSAGATKIYGIRSKLGPANVVPPAASGVSLADNWRAVSGPFGKPGATLFVSTVLLIPLALIRPLLSLTASLTKRGLLLNKQNNKLATRLLPGFGKGWCKKGKNLFFSSIRLTVLL
jgi:hypothetical protein